jgi:head-tail adaptor
MRAGPMRQQLNVFRHVEQTDPVWGSLVGSGGGTVNIGCFWASVKAGAGGEKVQDQGVQSYQQYTISARYQADVRTTDYLGWNGRRLEILSVADPDSTHRETVIEAMEYPSNG